jgi:hypothetical protein
MARPCFECARPASVEHHVVPQSRGGRHTVPLCDRCHSLAHDSTSMALANEGRRKKREEGSYLGGRPPYGYCLQGGGIVAVEHEQHAIAEIGRLYVAGLSAYAICGILDKSHHRPRGSRWSPGLVIKVLKRLGLWAVSPSTSDVPPRQRPAQ